MVYFFGCDGRGAGHYMWVPSTQNPTYPQRLGIKSTQETFGKDWVLFDSGYAPYIYRQQVVFRFQHEKYQQRGYEAPQGYYALHHLNGFTIMSWWDRCQGDTRPGSNSSIIAAGTLSADEMKVLLEQHFPLVAANLKTHGVQLQSITNLDFANA